jgi:hypothetical protein
LDRPQHTGLDPLTDSSTVDSVEQARPEHARRRRLVAEPLPHSEVGFTAADGISRWPTHRPRWWLWPPGGIGTARPKRFLVGCGAPRLRVTVGVVADGHGDLARSLIHTARAGGCTLPR